MTRVAALAASGRRALRILRPRDWGAVAGAVTVGTLLALALLLVVIDASRAREQATRALEAQAAQAMDARAAQTRRIDGLSEKVDGLQAEVAAQEGTIAAQSQAINDLSVQLRRAGSDPITGDPAADAPPSTGGSDLELPPRVPSKTSAPPRTADPAPEPARPDPAPDPAPQPAPPDESLCLPLDLLCIG